jgi:vacuolar-type H+-ATPase subunit H
MRRKKQEWSEETERKLHELRERLLNEKDQTVERERERG